MLISTSRLIIKISCLIVFASLFSCSVTGKIKNDDPNELPAYIGPDLRSFVMPRHYICMKTVDPITINGKLDEISWQNAKWSQAHVDIQGSAKKVKPRYETRVKMLWDNENLYIAAKINDPHIWATITKRNAVIYNDNDFEVFIDPDGDCHSYYEFEMNALNTVWNLFMNRPYKNGGQAKIREMPGQKSGVFIKGTLNKPDDKDKYWSVEIAFPFKAMREHAHTDCPPVSGQQWRINFSRVQWRHKIINSKYQRIPPHNSKNSVGWEENWVWSAQGVINMHRPETWGYVQFSDLPVTENNVKFIPDKTAHIRYLMFKILYAQEAYKLKHNHYASDLHELKLKVLSSKLPAKPIQLQNHGNNYTITAVINTEKDKTITLNLKSNGNIKLLSSPKPKH